MAGLGLGGLISGVDSDGIIQKLMRIEQQRIDTQESRKVALQAKQEAWNSVRTSLDTLRAKLDSLRLVSTFRSRSATLSDSTVATVTASTGATLTIHTLSVTQLAQSQVVAGSMYTEATSAVGVSGPLVINGKKISLVATDNLYSIRDKINTTAGVGVKADVVQVMQGGTTKYRMVLTSQSQGTAGAITMSGSSNAALVDSAGSTSATPWTVKVSKLAVTAKVHSDSVSDPAKLYTGSFTIAAGGQNYKLDFSSGATLAQIRDGINTAVPGNLASIQQDGSGADFLQLEDTAATPVGFSLTQDSGLLQELGLMKASNQDSVLQQAEYTISDGITETAYTSDTNVVAHTTEGLKLALNGTSATEAVTVGGVPQLLGLQSASGAHQNILSAARDAKFILDNVEYTKSTNVISDVLPKLSITLNKENASTAITVGQDADKLATNVEDWVKALNDMLTLLKSQTGYDSANKKAGILNGDTMAGKLQTALRSMLSNVVAGLPNTLNQLSQVGITTGSWGTEDYGKALLDKEKLKSQLLADPDGVAKVFGALRNNVAMSPTTQIESSPVSSRGVFATADVANGDTDSSRFGTAGGGWESADGPDPNVPGSAQNLDVYFDTDPAHLTKKSIDQVVLTIPDAGSYLASQSGLRNYSLKYLGDDNVWHEITKVTDHTGSAKILEFDPVLARGIRLSVTATYGTSAVTPSGFNPARVTELEVNEFNNGGAIAMHRYLKTTLAFADGPIDVRTTNLTDQVDDIDKQIERMTAQMERRQQALRDQFARMEAALARMQSQGNMLLGQLGMNQSK